MKPLLLHDLVERLVENARLMVELSRGVPEKQQIEDLQEIQGALISEIKQISKKATVAAQEKAISERLALFQKLNQQFIANLSVRKDLIGIDIGQIQAQQELLISKIQVNLSTAKTPQVK